jgi:hypothetical protein
VWRFLQKFKLEEPYDPAIPFLDIYPKELNSGSHRVSSTPMFISELLLIVKGRNNLKSLTDEWTEKM